MARQPRIEFAGAMYHVMARGNHRSEIFLDDEDRNLFLDTLDEVCARTGWEVYAWVLMTNHYHLAIRTPEANLVEGMKWFQNTYTRRFNKRHREWGRLFGDRYKAELVQTGKTWDEAQAFCPGSDRGRPPRNETARYLRTLIDYIHLNPARAGIVQLTPGRGRGGKRADEMGLLAYPWSSLTKGYAVTPANRPDWLVAKDGFRYVSGQDTPDGRRAYVEGLESRVVRERERYLARERGEDPNAIERSNPAEDRSGFDEFARTWYWGSQKFGEMVREGFFRSGEAASSLQANANYRSSELAKSHGEAGAERILERAAEHFGLQVDEMPEMKRGDLRRAAIAWAIWTTTVGVSQRWIADRLGVRTKGTVSTQITRFGKLADANLNSEILMWKREFVE
jgi:REP element-mobilizing transposase RayT